MLDVVPQTFGGNSFLGIVQVALKDGFHRGADGWLELWSIRHELVPCLQGFSFIGFSFKAKGNFWSKDQGIPGVFGRAEPGSRHCMFTPAMPVRWCLNGALHLEVLLKGLYFSPRQARRVDAMNLFTMRRLAAYGIALLA